MNKIIATSLALTTMTLMTAGLQNAYADTDKTAQVPNISQQQPQAQQPWLGVALSPVPEVLSRQLEGIIPARQGVMVQSVSPDSPAQKAGILAFDIILNYGDQKLYSIEQLVSLVASDAANNEVTLGVIRNSAKKDIKVTLGSRVLPTPSRARHPMFNFYNQPIHPMMPAFPNTMPGFKMPSSPDTSEKAHIMQQFESIKVQKLNDDRYRAEVEYQENTGEESGEKKKFAFEGKYNEIREQIKNNKDLPESKKNSLLNALKNNPDWLIPDNFMDFPTMPKMPAMPSFENYLDNIPQGYRNKKTL